MLESGIDLAGNRRLHGRRIDIGCFECPSSPGLVIIIQ
jgi:hypothetical protein